MLKLVCGASGAGKTALLTDLIAQDIQNGIRCFLLVPEQQAYISERDLPAMLPQNAGLFFEVVHFSGLAEAVFREYGGVTQGTLDNGTRTVLMWDTLRELSPILLQYGKNAKNDTALATLMLQTVTELHNNGITAEKLETAAQDLSPDSTLQKKISDLALVAATFRQKSEDLFGTDPSDKLARMAKLLQENKYFQNCHLYIDSFTSFTAQEYAVLQEILKQASLVTVALCADSFSSRLPHFESVMRTAKRLNKLALQVNIPIEKIELPAKDAEKPAALVKIERDIWRFDAKHSATNQTEEDGSVSLLSCTNLYEEAEAAALHISELVQNGMHYGEIAVVVRDTEAYRGILDAAFERYRIPYFLSEATDLASKPLSRLVLSALRAIHRHYHVQDIMTLVKTGLTGADFSDAAMFEEYCETWLISGSRFTDETWSMNPDGLTTEMSARAKEILEAANRVRRIVMEPLLLLEAELRQSNKLLHRCRALYRYLCKLNIPQQLSDRAKKELLADNRREAGETVRLYRFLTESMMTLCRVLPNAEVTTEELIAVFSLFFSKTELASVPNLHDCVVIGSASTLRVENIRASLLLGLCEGDFPRTVTDDGILTDGDKEELEHLGLTLDSRTDVRTSDELLYVYRAMTKPCEHLFLSTVTSGLDGATRTPSLAFSRVCLLLNRRPQIFDLDAIRIALNNHETSRRHEPLMTLPAADCNVTLRLSQSKIRTFMLCPYSYYSIYRIHLREKKDSRPSYADDGIFLHYVFEHFLKASLGKDKKLHLPPEDEIPLLANQIVEDYLACVCPLPPEMMNSRLLHLFARLKKMSLIMLKDMVAELKISAFVPSKFEQVIGAPEEGGLPPVVLTLKNGARVTLNGKVDRIDLLEQNGKLYVRVVDYKSGMHKFSLDDVRSGMDIQLVLYLFAVLSSNPAHYLPGGAQYLYAVNEKGKIGVGRSGFLLSESEIADAADAEEAKRYTKKLLPQSAEEIAALFDDMNQAVIHAAERILAGEAQKTPSEQACMFCPVRANCDKAYSEKERSETE